MKEEPPKKRTRYSIVSSRIRKICDLAESIQFDLAWYIEVTRKLTLRTAHRTGINGDVIEEIARKILELKPSLEKLKEKTKQLDKNIQSARLN